MSIYNKLDYRVIFRNLVEDRKKIDPKTNFQSLAAAMKMQKPYLSKILHGGAHMNTDQLYLACEYLGLDQPEQLYLDLLLEYSRTSLKSRKTKLKQQIEKLQHQHFKTESHLESTRLIQGEDLGTYYTDPYVQIVHLFLSVERYRINPQNIAKDLDIPKEKLQSCLRTLHELKIISMKNGTVEQKVRNIHLPSRSPWTQPNHILMRLLSMNHLQAQRAVDPYRISVTFSANLATCKKIQEGFLELLKKSETWVKNSENEDVFQLNFDLFGWTR